MCALITNVFCIVRFFFTLFALYFSCIYCTIIHNKSKLALDLWHVDNKDRREQVGTLPTPFMYQTY